jgi:hypothetical protein
LMARNRTKALIDRRAVLLGSAVAVQAPLLLEAAASPAPVETPEGGGPKQPTYSETEHIRTFYARSRF